ncbi:hypothetical protein [Agromyces sp. LHK192]|uniref:hypothetical protein n=1 Tax=Agromyces sp. LHK192 TaxID=2498704 RepID=UPI0013E3C297|nr:hypothetical protein [Agromyces sp. LHK192]
MHQFAAPLIVLAAGQDEFDPNDVTPGVAGFVLTILVMVAVVFIGIDMVRRVRRVNYRAEVRAQIEAEQQAAAAAEAGDVDGEAVDGGSARGGASGPASGSDASGTEGSGPGEPTR